MFTNQKNRTYWKWKPRFMMRHPSSEVLPVELSALAERNTRRNILKRNSTSLERAQTSRGKASFTYAHVYIIHTCVRALAHASVEFQWFLLTWGLTYLTITEQSFCMKKSRCTVLYKNAHCHYNVEFIKRKCLRRLESHVTWLRNKWNQSQMASCLFHMENIIKAM